MSKFANLTAKLANYNYYSARAYYKRRLHQKRMLYPKTPILIYQMGKVGSSSVKRSLETYSLNRPIFHVHFLRKERIKEIERERKKYFRSSIKTYKRPWLYQYLRHQIDTIPSGEKWKIITLVREPVARNISTFYENIEFELLDTPGCYRIKSDYYQIAPMIIRSDDLVQLESLFFDRLDHDVPINFFNKELKDVLNIDVFQKPFSYTKGYSIYSNQRVDVLVMRLESLNNCAQEAFEEFLNIKNFTILNDNVGSKKVYAPIYKAFKSRVGIPSSYIDKLYNSEYMQYFYSRDEIEQFKQQWSREK